MFAAFAFPAACCVFVLFAVWMARDAWRHRRQMNAYRPPVVHSHAHLRAATTSVGDRFERKRGRRSTVIEQLESELTPEPQVSDRKPS